MTSSSSSSMISRSQRKRTNKGAAGNGDDVSRDPPPPPPPPPTTTRTKRRTQTRFRLFRNQTHSWNRPGRRRRGILLLLFVFYFLATCHWFHHISLLLVGRRRRRRLRQSSFSPEQLPEWISRYVQFHRQQVVAVPRQRQRRRQRGDHNDDATTTTTTVNDQDYYYDYTLASDSIPTLRYVCHEDHICGGVGDRIKSILSTLYFALCTHRTLLVQIDAPSDVTRYLQPNLILWNATVPSNDNKNKRRELDLMNQTDHPAFADPSAALAHLPTHVDVRLNRWQPTKLKDSPCLKRQLSLSSQPNVDNANDDPKYNLGDKNLLFYHLFWTLFRFSDATTERAEQMKRAAGLSSTKSSSSLPNFYVAVHIRTGDSFVGYDNVTRHHDKDTVPRFYQCAASLQRALQTCFGDEDEEDTTGWAPQSPQSRRRRLPDIYIASDNVETKRSFVAQDPVTIKQAYQEEIFHVDLSQRRRPHPARGNDDDHHTKDDASSSVGDRELTVWAELKVLVDAICVVHSQSGYSRIAFAAGNRPRCAVRFDQCDEPKVQRLMKNMGC